MGGIIFCKVPPSILNNGYIILKKKEMEGECDLKKDEGREEGEARRLVISHPKMAL